MMEIKALFPNKQWDGLKHWSPVSVMTPEAASMSCPCQGCTGWGMQQRRYLQLPMSAHYHFPLLTTISSDWFPWGQWSGQIGSFACSFSVSSAQCYKPHAFRVYYSFPQSFLSSRRINLKVPLPHSNLNKSFLQDLRLTFCLDFDPP